jgi:hypothetical protein
MQLGADLALAWSHAAATVATRKRIVRAALSEIVVRVEAEHIEMILHWQGGDHTVLKLRWPRFPWAQALQRAIRSTVFLRLVSRRL